MYIYKNTYIPREADPAHIGVAMDVPSVAYSAHVPGLEGRAPADSMLSPGHTTSGLNRKSSYVGPREEKDARVSDLCVCVCVCMHVCMYVCMCVCMCAVVCRAP